MRVQLNLVDPERSDSRVVTMQGCPREGDLISFDGSYTFIVHEVIWLIDDPNADVQVRYR